MRSFRYEAWANRRVLESLKQPGVPEGAIRLFAHILAAQQAWLARMKGEDPSRIRIWPDADLPECENLLAEMGAAIIAYLESLDDGGLDQGVTYRPTYRNPEGRSYRHTPLDIFTHLALHSHYHRGQVAVHIRQAGGTPAGTDFMVYLRENPEEATPARQP